MIVFLLIIALTTALTILMIKWKQFNKNESYSLRQFIEPRFEEFLKLYKANPKNWILLKDNVVFKKHFRGNDLQVQFSFLDYLRYRVFLFEHERSILKEKTEKAEQIKAEALQALRDETWK